jgi:glutathionylspermidine synthase
VYRHLVKPRKDWRRIVEEQGLTYAVDRAENGSERPYWHEAAVYELSEEEIEYLEGLTEELHDMSVEAARRMVEDPGIMARLGFPPEATELMRASLLDPDTPTLYGRFDLAYDGTGPAKLLEYNADTPTGLVEASVTQWYWLEDTLPDYDQWNMLHERLVQAWTLYAPRVPDEVNPLRRRGQRAQRGLGDRRVLEGCRPRGGVGGSRDHDGGDRLALHETLLRGRPGA